MSKGDKIYVEGRLKNRQWQGEDGNTRYSTEVQVQDFTFLSTKKESMANAQASQSQQPPVTTNVNEAKETEQVSEPNQEDDLPF